MAEGLQKKAEESYSQVFGENLDLKEEVKQLKEEYAKLEESAAEGTDEMFENLKAQLRVIAPEVDLSPLNLDMVMIDMKIVPPPWEWDILMSELKALGEPIRESSQR